MEPVSAPRCCPQCGEEAEVLYADWEGEPGDGEALCWSCRGLDGPRGAPVPERGGGVIKAGAA